MKSTYFFNTIKGCLRLLGVMAGVVVVSCIWVVGWVLFPYTITVIAIVAAIWVAILIAANNTRNMMP
jgi:uncharacterized membrane protein